MPADNLDITLNKDRRLECKLAMESADAYMLLKVRHPLANSRIPCENDETWSQAYQKMEALLPLKAPTALAAEASV